MVTFNTKFKITEFHSPTVSSRLNPVCPRTMYTPPVSGVFITEHGFPGKQTLP